MKDKSTNFHFPKNPEEIKYPIYPGQFSVRGRLRAVKHKRFAFSIDGARLKISMSFPLTPSSPSFLNR
jgi:hypothetical protein